MRDDLENNFASIQENLLAGNFVVLKTDTIYGILARALDENAVQNLKKIRERDAAQGFIILLDNVKFLDNFSSISDQQKLRAKNIWHYGENPTSIIFEIEENEKFAANFLFDRRSKNPTICFRIPREKMLRKIIEKVGPVVAPSANLHGEIPAKNIKMAREYFGDTVSLYVDGGEISDNISSRIVQILRDGAMNILRDDRKIHPEDNIISRPRKLYKFAKFLEMENCFDLEKFLKNRKKIFAEIVAKKQKINLEIAAGSALFSVKNALKIAEKNQESCAQNSANFSLKNTENYCKKDDVPEMFFCVDIKSDRLIRGAKMAQQNGLKNIIFIRSDIWNLAKIFPENSVDKMWLTFPDPWEADSRSRHRLTNARFLKIYQKILRENGRFNFKTDNEKLFEYSVQEITQNGFAIEFLTRDLHGENSGIPCEFSDAKMMTSYEEKFVAEAKKINFLASKKI